MDYDDAGADAADDYDSNYDNFDADADAADEVVESVPPLWLLSPNIGALHFVTSSLLLLLLLRTHLLFSFW